MSNLTVSVLFTMTGGAPATGLALADILIYLRSRNKITFAVAFVWNGVNPTEEVGGGMYSRSYASADNNTFDYFADAEYVGGVVLDSNYSLMGAPESFDCCSHAPGAIEYTYTVLDSVSLAPVEGVEVWVALDTAPSVVVWNGDTDAFGVVRDNFGNKPWLDAGTYRFYKQKAGYFDTDTPYDTEIVS